MFCKFDTFETSNLVVMEGLKLTLEWGWTSQDFNQWEKKERYSIFQTASINIFLLPVRNNFSEVEIVFQCMKRITFASRAKQKSKKVSERLCIFMRVSVESIWNLKKNFACAQLKSDWVVVFNCLIICSPALTLSNFLANQTSIDILIFA